MSRYSSGRLSSPYLPDLPCGFLVDAGRYEILNRIGSGSFGVVYRALERVPGSDETIVRAIKVMPFLHTGGPYGANAKEAKERAVATMQDREMSLHERASGHPNVVTLRRCMYSDKYAYIVMDYVSGGNLRHAVRERMCLADRPVEVKRIMLQIIDAVAACHEKGIYHGDLKPSNILTDLLMTQMFLADFGMASDIRESKEFRHGTYRYICPGKWLSAVESQQYQDAHTSPCPTEGLGYPALSFDRQQNDIWALGIILLELVCGCTMWEEATTAHATFRQFIRNPMSLRRTFPLSPACVSLLARVLAVDPAERLSLAEFRTALCEVPSFWIQEWELCAMGDRTVRVLEQGL
ncbi:kinase-like domain-containing protein [Epithele typhae]|uniref:kinase-like domain-containing protein n=1 Tax=Epithele typhae TaxID=378194 RepID=UPI00200762E5|nr:kinase-like domain-containing protein [Epithele typhae]KAH9931678.1 kinase-like domain-containing protein [Epithele typhae]